MRRLFWLALGAGVGVAGVRRARKAARAWTPSGVAGRFAGAGEAAREFAEDVRAGMAERELELRSSLGLEAGHASPNGEVRGSRDTRYEKGTY
jgi:hypothetical protein